MVRLFFLRVFESFFRHRWLNLLPLGLMTIAAVLFFLFSPPPYISRGAIYVQGQSLIEKLDPTVAQDGWNYNSPAQMAVTDMQNLMETESFAVAILSQTNLRDQIAADPTVIPEMVIALRQAVTLTVAGENLVKISVEDETAENAFGLAKGTIDVYKAWKLDNDLRESDVAQEFFASIIQPYRDELTGLQDELQGYLEANPDPVRGERPDAEVIQIAQYQQRIEVANTRLQDAIEKEEAARLARTKAESNVNQTYVVVDDPQVPIEAKRTPRQTLTLLVTFLALGGLLVTIAVVAGMLLDRSFLVPYDVQHQIELPVLALVPVSPPRFALAAEEASTPSRVIFTAPPSSTVEEVRT